MGSVPQISPRFASRFLILPNHKKRSDLNCLALYDHVRTHVSAKLKLEVSPHEVFLTVPEALDTKLREHLAQYHIRCVQTYPTRHRLRKLA